MITQLGTPASDKRAKSLCSKEWAAKFSLCILAGAKRLRPSLCVLAGVERSSMGLDSDDSWSRGWEIKLDKGGIIHLGGLLWDIGFNILTRTPGDNTNMLVRWLMLLLLSHSVVSNSMWPHRQQPTRLHRSWDSPGKNTGVGYHFLLQCMRVESESEVAQLCPTLNDPMDCSSPGSSVHGIFQARVLEWGAIAFFDH